MLLGILLVEVIGLGAVLSGDFLSSDPGCMYMR